MTSSLLPLMTSLAPYLPHACMTLALVVTCRKFAAARRASLRLDDVMETASVPRHWFWGHRPVFGFGGDMLRNLVAISKSFPLGINFWILPHKSMPIYYHPTTAAPMLTSSAPKSELIYGLLRSWVGDGLLTSSGEKWRRHRKLITPAFHFEQLKSYVPKINESARTFVRMIGAEMSDGEVNICPFCTRMTLDTILKCAMSSDTNCQTDINNSSTTSYVNLVSEVTECVVLRTRNPYYLSSLLFDLSPVGWRFRRAVATLRKRTAQLIKKRREELEMKDMKSENEPQQTVHDDCGTKKRKTKDFIDILLTSKDENGRGMTDEEIGDEVETFLFAGHDTTASGLSWTIYNLAKYPELQEKCREEIASIVGDRKGDSLNIEWSDTKRMSYVSRFIKESLRLFPPVYFIARTCCVVSRDDDVTSASHVHDVGTHVYALHRNPHVWRDPEVFDPERFNPENSSKRCLNSFLPFSAGPRNCIGQGLAMSEMKIAVCHLLTSYRLRSTHPPPLPMPRLTLKAQDGIRVALAPL